MVFADDIRKTILILADQRGGGEVFYSQEVARLVDAENWPKLVDHVQLVAESLIQEGYLVPVQNGTVEKAYAKPYLLNEEK